MMKKLFTNTCIKSKIVSSLISIGMFIVLIDLISLSAMVML